MPKVTLARVAVADADELIRANIESREYHRPWAHPFTDHPGFDEWFMHKTNGPNVCFLARELATNEIVGVINLNEIVRGAFQSAYLGYYGMVRTARRGLMTEALRMAVEEAFGELGLHRVEANIQPGNIASITLVRRLGFRKEGFSPRYLNIGGEWRDHERWALTAEEFH